MLEGNKGDIAPVGLRDASTASRGHGDKGQAPGQPLSWAADASQAAHSHHLAWKQGFQKHMLVVNKPKERETSPRLIKEAVSQALRGAGPQEEGEWTPERWGPSQASSAAPTWGGLCSPDLTYAAHLYKSRLFEMSTAQNYVSQRILSSRKFFSRGPKVKQLKPSSIC